MTCYQPIPAFVGGPGQQARLLPPLGTANIEVRCGKCLGCRTDKAKEWGERCYHEAQCHEHNVFVTLTYDDEHVPWSLRPDHVRLWMYRLRKLAREGADVLTSGKGVRFFLSGEYGEVTGRPHYHVLLFNCGFADKVKATETLWRSEVLERSWGKGSALFGEVSGASAAYTAGYAVKKLGEKPTEVSADGEVRIAPFMRCSRRPGIGLGWLRTYAADVRGGFVVAKDGQKMPVPRYYRKKLEGSQLLEECEEATHERMKATGRRPEARLRAKEAIHRRLVELKGPRRV